MCKILQIIRLLRQYIKDLKYGNKTKREIYYWEHSGRPIPPPHIVKQTIIADYQKSLKYKFFIETGTYLGEMVNAQLKNFEQIISIELGHDLYEAAVKKFKHYSKVRIINGDSGLVLDSVMQEINEPAVFWLDGHYSEGNTARGDKDCPIFEELNAILSSDQNHLLLIDDARMFNGQGDYPIFKDLKDFILLRKSASRFEVKDDIIRVFLLELNQT